MTKLLLSPLEVAEVLSMSRSKFYQLCSSGRFAPLPIKFGRKTLYRAVDIEFWVESGCPARSEWQQKRDAEKR